MAQTQKISINRALTTLKNIKVEIDTYFSTPRNLMGFQIGASGNNTNFPNMNAAQVASEAQSAYDKIAKLISRQLAIKQAIANSNATTLVTVNNKSMTVSDAIIMRNLVPVKETLLAQLRRVNNDTNKTFEALTKQFETRVDQLTSETISDTMNADERAQAIIQMRKTQEDVCKPRVIDPNNLSDKIKELETEINFLKNELDIVLSESNTNTTIEVQV